MRLAILPVLLASAVGFAAEVTLRAPCGSDPIPAYAPVGAPPASGVWMSKDAKALIEAPCADELGTAFRAIVTLSGSFRFQGDLAQLLERVGAISSMKGIPYWSTTDKKWTELIPKSYALERPGSKARPDFTAAEMLSGKDLFYAQSDYRMRVTTRGQDQITAQIQNVTPVTSFLITAYAAGDVRNVHFLKRRSADVWDYYPASTVRESRIPISEASLVNRAAALYRHVVGQRTDEDPPLAR